MDNGIDEIRNKRVLHLLQNVYNKEWVGARVLDGREDVVVLKLLSFANEVEMDEYQVGCCIKRMFINETQFLLCMHRFVNYFVKPEDLNFVTEKDVDWLLKCNPFIELKYDRIGNEESKSEIVQVLIPQRVRKIYHKPTKKMFIITTYEGLDHLGRKEYAAVDLKGNPVVLRISRRDKDFVFYY